MKLLALLLLVVFIAAAIWFFLIPEGVIYITQLPIGLTVSVSRGEIRFDPGPDRFASNGFEHIEPYVKRLVGSSADLTSVSIFTLDGNRGFGLSARGAAVEAGFIVDTQKEIEREAAVRAFFDSRGIAPAEDYVTAVNSFRVLSYPVSGGTSEVTTLTKQILQDLCRVTPQEGLQFSLLAK